MMKRIALAAPAPYLRALAALALLIILGHAREARAQWTTSNGTTTTSDKVGVGTSDPGNALEVRRDQAFNGTPGSMTQLVVRNDSPSGFSAFSIWGNGAERGRYQYNSASPNIFLTSIGQVPFNFGTNDTVRMTIDGATGNVGVGTASPGHRLDVKGPDVRFGNYADDAGAARSDSVSNTLYIARSSRSDQYTSIGPGYAHKAMITTRETGQWVSDMGPMIMLRSSYTTLGNPSYPYAWAGGNVELYYKRPGAMVSPFTSSTKFYDDTTTLPAYTNFKPELGFILNSAGNVGIGTANPAGRLSVVDGPHLSVYTTPGYGPTFSKDGLTVVANPDVGYSSLVVRSGHSPVADRGLLRISRYDGISPQQEVLYARMDGNVGVGTTAPAYRLDVAGHVRSSSGGFVFPDGTVQTTAASGGGTSSLAAANISQGQFGASTGGGNYSFPASVLMSGSTASLIDTGPNNRFRVCGPNGACATAGEYIGGRIRLSPDGSFAAAEGLADPGMGGINAPGNVIVGGNLSATGTITGGHIQAKYQDVAEWVPSTQKLAPGTVVVLDPARSNHVLASASAYDTSVAGVVSAQPGLILGEGGEGKVKVATTGRVKVRVDATSGPIKIGDLLVTSDVAGVAMRSEPMTIGGRRIHAPGTIIGKALEPLAGGTGEILVLLSLQ